jgi:hypothetical protein
MSARFEASDPCLERQLLAILLIKKHFPSVSRFEQSAVALLDGLLSAKPASVRAVGTSRSAQRE